jgi:hypothetical protein
VRWAGDLHGELQLGRGSSNDTPITRRDALKLMGAGAAVAGTLGLVAESAEAAPVALGSKPSVLLIVLDEVR